MSKYKIFSKLMALALTLALALSLLPGITLTASAEGNDIPRTGKAVTAFDALEDSIRYQVTSSPGLPETIGGTVDGLPVEIPVTWEAEGFNPAGGNDPGFYVLFAQPAEGYFTGGDAQPPKITLKLLPEMSPMAIGGGTELDPLQITNARQLAEVAELVNAGKLESFWFGDSTKTIFIKMMNDIDLSAYGKNWNGGAGWMPIGINDTNYFKGNFDGGYKKITGLFIDRADYNIGLFGYISGGVVSNLGLENVNITGKTNYTGGLAGCVATGGIVQNCYVTGAVSGSYEVGGVAGFVGNSGTVQNCYSIGAVSGSNYVGGLVGTVTGGTVKSCYVTGAVSGTANNVGGVAGYVGNSGTVQNCYAIGAISGTNNVGGLAGAVVGNGILHNCAALNPSVTGSTNVGRVVGSSYSIIINNIAFSGMTGVASPSDSATGKDGASKTAADLQVAGGFPWVVTADPWTYTEGKLPVLTGFVGQDSSMSLHLLPSDVTPFAGTGESGTPYEISTPAQLAKLAELVNSEATNSTYGGSGVYYKLTAYLDLSAYGANWNGGAGWTPIGINDTNPFKGNFDGGNHKITGLYIDYTDYYCTGLFGQVEGTVKNLGLENVDITGGNNVGGVTGAVVGTAQNCYVTGTVSGIDADGGGKNESYYVGGVAGFVGISSTVQNCYATGVVSGTDSVGGVAGRVSNCTVQYCAALNPSITGDTNVGRVVGYFLGGILSNNVAFDGMTCVSKGVSFNNGSPKTAAELQVAGGFPWDVTTAPWTYTEGKLPILTGLAGQDGAMPLYLTPRLIAGATVTVAPGPYTYDSTAKIPDVTVNFGDKTLSKGTDYTVSYTDNTNAGSATITVTGIGDFGGTKTANFTIAPKALTWVAGTVSNKVYDGTTAATIVTAPTLDGVIVGDSVTVVAGSAAFADANVATGIAVTATGYGISGDKATNYSISGQPSLGTANITKKDISINTVAAPVKDWDGTADIPTPGAVTFSGEAAEQSLVRDTDYTVTAEFTDGNYDAGSGKSYTYTVTMQDTTKANNYNLTGTTMTGDDGTIEKKPQTNISGGFNVKASEAKSIEVPLPLPRFDAAYSASIDVADAGGLIASCSISGTTLTVNTNSSAADTSATITAYVTGATNHADYKVVMNVTAVNFEPETTPEASIDFTAEKLTGLVADAAYTVNGTPKTADADGNIAIDAAWFSETLSIIKIGSDDDTSVDSAAQSLPVPARDVAPTVGKTDTTGGGSNGTITGVDSAMQYRGTGAWIPVTDTTVTGLAAGTYQVRLQATATAFASESASVTIASSSGGGGGGSGGGGGGTPSTPAAPETGDNKLTTPSGQKPVVDKDGNTTLPGGGTIETPGGSEIKAPAGTTIDKDGNITVPSGKEAEATLPGGADIMLPGGSTISGNGDITTGGDAQLNLPGDTGITLPVGSTIANNGRITVGTGGATVNRGGIELHIGEGLEIILDEDVPLGYLISAQNPFIDVHSGDWFYDDLMFVYTHGLMTGTADAAFSPGGTMTRGMFATVLSRLDGADLSNYSESSFGDVESQQWYAPPIEWAAENGIVIGTGGGNFSPDAPVTREQMLVILYNYMQFKGITIPAGTAVPFADEDSVSSWALEAVQAMQAMGIVTGRPGNIFDPQGIATRAEVAAVFARFLDCLK